MGMLIAYGPSGDIIAVLDGMVILDFETQRAFGHADFGAAEAQGIESTAFWRLTTYDRDKHDRPILRTPQPVKGSKFWPEALGGQAHQFRAELDGPPGDKRVVALVHKGSGHVRERAAIEAKVAEAEANGRPLRSILGSQGRPLTLDDNGRERPETRSRPSLPIVPTKQHPARP